jgi:hypothetical protein
MATNATVISDTATLLPSDSASQVEPSKKDTAQGGGRARGRSAKNAISKDTPPGAVQVPKGGQNKTNKQSPVQTATIQLTGWEDLDLAAIRTETVPTFTVDVNPYVDLVDTEFDRIVARCPSIGKFVPFALFRYYCFQLWWYRVILLHKMNGQILTTGEKNFINSFSNGGEDYVIPTHIAQYLANMGNFIQGGETYFFRKVAAQFGGHTDDSIVEDGWLDCHNGDPTIVNGPQFWAYAQVPVPAVFATSIVNEVIHNDPSRPQLQTLEHIEPVLEDPDLAWKATNNIAGWMTRPRLFNHSSHRQTYWNLGWTTGRIPSDVQTPFLFSPASMRWMSDRLSTIKELKTYPSKQIALSSMGSPIQAYWLEAPDKFLSYDLPDFRDYTDPDSKATRVLDLALTSRFGVDPKSATPAYSFGFRLARDKVITGYDNRQPVYAERSNYQPWITVIPSDDEPDVIHDPPPGYLQGMNQTWIFGSAANLNIVRFQTQVLRRDDALSRTLILTDNK